MTKQRVTSPSLYEQAMDLQDQLVRRGMMPARAHDVAVDDSYSDVRGTAHVHCTCGVWVSEPEQTSEQAYAQHVWTAVGSRRRLAVAA